MLNNNYHIKKEGDVEGTSMNVSYFTLSGKRRMAFLDLLIDMMEKGKLTLQQLYDEVDTFMFEGHDTTTTGMNWALFLLGLHPEIQTKVHQEIDEILGNEDRDVSSSLLEIIFYRLLLRIAFKSTKN